MIKIENINILFIIIASILTLIILVLMIILTKFKKQMKKAEKNYKIKEKTVDVKDKKNKSDENNLEIELKSINLNKLTKNELIELLDVKGINYSKNLTKSELAEIAKDHFKIKMNIK